MLLSQFPPFRYFHNFSEPPKHTLAFECHVYIWHVSPQLSCGDTCQIWTWLKEFNEYFCKIKIVLTEKLANGALVTPTQDLHHICACRWPCTYRGARPSVNKVLTTISGKLSSNILWTSIMFVFSFDNIFLNGWRNPIKCHGTSTVNSWIPDVQIWRHKNWSPLVQLTACCPPAPNLNLTKWWLFNNQVR